MIFRPLHGRLCDVVIDVMDGVTMMPEVYVGYDLQDGPTDAQNGHDGQGQRYGHLWMRAKQENPKRAVWRCFRLTRQQICGLTSDLTVFLVVLYSVTMYRIPQMMNYRRRQEGFPQEILKVIKTETLSDRNQHF